MHTKTSTTNQSHPRKSKQINWKTSTQKSNMGKYSISKRRHSHQSKILRTKQEETLIGKNLGHLNSLTHVKQQRSTVTAAAMFRPLAASTPYNIHAQTNSIHDNSPHFWKRSLLSSPVYCSTPKPNRRPILNCKEGRSKYLIESHPPLPVISPRRLQFTPHHAPSFGRYSNDDSKRVKLPNVKVWLL